MNPRRRPPGDPATPREQLFTLGLFALAAAPLLRHLEWRVGAFVLAALALRLAALRWPAALPGRWALALLALGGLANVVAAYHTAAGQYGGSALFLTMLTLKLLELRERRDLRLVAILICFLIVIQFLFDQSFALALYLGTVAFAIIVALAALNAAPRKPLPKGRAPRIAASLALQALPLTAVLFVLFPRLDAPLWNLGRDENRAVTGLSETMEPGSVSKLVLNGDPAFRVRFEGPAPPTEQLYWRTLVLWDMDGRRWTGDAPSATPGQSAAIQARGAPLGYEITLEPTGQRWLPALDLPIASDRADLTIGPEHTLIARQSVIEPARYRVHSALDYRTTEESEARRARALQLPPGITPRMRELVARWRASGGGDAALVEQALEYFNRQNFHYTLLPPPLGANPTDAFLFETRSGFCEHYASAFALLMRLAGIPARIVTGYLGGEANRLGGYLLVRQSDAHAWVEVLLPTRGWTRIDPTGAVDPSRIDHRAATRLLGAGGSVRFDLSGANTLARFGHRLGLLADALEAGWQDWVLDYSSADQLALLKQLGLGAHGQYALAGAMIAALGAALSAILLTITRRERLAPDRLERLHARLCRRLAMIDLPRRPHEGPRDYARRVIRQRPDLAPTVTAFTRIYLPARFADKPDPAAPTHLARLLKGFRPRRRAPHRHKPRGETAQ